MNDCFYILQIFGFFFFGLFSFSFSLFFQLLSKSLISSCVTKIAFAFSNFNEFFGFWIIFFMFYYVLRITHLTSSQATLWHGLCIDNADIVCVERVPKKVSVLNNENFFYWKFFFLKNIFIKLKTLQYVFKTVFFCFVFEFFAFIICRCYFEHGGIFFFQLGYDI